MEHEATAIDASLDALLILMHEASSHERVVAGYPSEAAGMKLYRPSRQYDHDNGAADCDADASLGHAVEAQVDQMAEPHRTAIRVNARNLATGHHVWSSARLPLCPVERSILIMEARNQIMRRLQTEGLL